MVAAQKRRGRHDATRAPAEGILEAELGWGPSDPGFFERLPPFAALVGSLTRDHAAAPGGADADSGRGLVAGDDAGAVEEPALAPGEASGGQGTQWQWAGGGSTERPAARGPSLEW